ncbi:FeoC-like transcriptional regulator [Consotaella salsifontis]|uniref:FeoC like transcriptional regulator n=1 Tax=Consotaella salsifontis TaxID=1365950 RepID=A0A1T4NII6_9HYPH|nr:FeoC-like transcriptional regulator [Consotaella salsifontis]SJZ78943.1 FeoC like transcriptional regulator [Consotaella salsifontis]
MAGLTQLRDLLKAEKRLSLDQLALKSGSTPSAVEAMLAHWERKGQVARIETKPQACAGSSACCCSRCPDPIYEWRGGH